MQITRSEPPANVGQRVSNGGLFRAGGRNLAVTFALITSLFLLWGFCNGMIDILNKHFQDTLRINKEQSGLVQAANYLAYFLMAIPAGLMAKKFGYKGAWRRLPIRMRRFWAHPKAALRASTSPRRPTVWAGFWGRSSAGILFFPALTEPMPMPASPRLTSGLGHL